MDLQIQAGLLPPYFLSLYPLKKAIPKGLNVNLICLLSKLFLDYHLHK